jgi:hypothetical protein
MTSTTSHSPDPLAPDHRAKTKGDDIELPHLGSGDFDAATGSVEAFRLKC